MVAARVPGPPGAAPYVVIDLETTGLEPDCDRIVECALLTLDGRGAIFEEWTSLVALPAEVPLRATEFHRLDAVALADAPSFSELLGAVRARVANRVLVGHVLSFDVAFLTAEAARVGYALPELGRAGLCTQELARDHLLGDSYSLSSCAQRAGVELRDAHTALGDARATAGLFARLIADGHVDAHEHYERAARLVWAESPRTGQPARARFVTPTESPPSLALSLR